MRIAQLSLIRIYCQASIRGIIMPSWIRCDISSTVSSLARFDASSGSSHWAAALLHLMEHLEGIASLKVAYRRSTGVDEGLSGLADSDWGNSSSRRSTSCNLCFYKSCPILWRSKMQKTTTCHKAEYYAVSTAATEVLFLRNHLENLGFSQQAPTPVYENKTACIEWGTMSLADGNSPSTLTFGSISPTK
jgi:hypothetical protein